MGEGAATAASPTRRQARLVLFATVVGSAMVFVDGAIVNVALPVIQTEFGAGAAGAQWIVNAYMLCLGALILLGGAAGDGYGLRRMFLFGAAFFGAASVACGMAQSVGQLIAARAVQGVAGAVLAPSSLALLRATFDETERGRAVGTWAAAGALTTAAGPILGGFLVDYASWRFAFLINAPLAVVAATLALRAAPERRKAKAAALDWLGGALATIGLGAISWALIAAPERGWTSPGPLGAFLGGLGALTAFAWRERRAKAPMTPPALFRSRVFVGANVMTLLLYFGLSGVLFLLPFALIQVHGYSAAEAGAAFLPLGLALGFLSRWAGGVADRFGSRLPLTLGSAVAGLGFAALAIPGVAAGGYWTSYFPGMALTGLGMAIVVAPLTATVLSAVEEDRAGAAAGINNAAARVAGLLAVAALGALVASLFRARLGVELTQLDLPDAARHMMLAASARLADTPIPETLTPESQAAARGARDAAFLTGFRWAAAACAALALSASATAAFTIDGKQAPSDGEKGGKTAI